MAAVKEFPSERVEEIFSRFPTKEAAILPLLHLAQELWGYVDKEVIDLVAEKTEVSPAKVWGVATFYTMYHKKAPGKTHIRVCTNISCMVRGGYEILKKVQEKIKDFPENTFSVEEVECLGACECAPVIMVGDEYMGPVDPEKVEKILEEKGGK